MADGRVFRGERRVRLGDVTAAGRVRLDALARILHDIGNDDTMDIGVGAGGAWVTRRVELTLTGALPSYLDTLTFATWCGGVGARWAERRTDLVAADGSRIETATVWVHVDPETGRAAPLPEWFVAFSADVSNRRVDHRLRLPEAPKNAQSRVWPLRAADFDVLGHVNNAIVWAAVEDEIQRFAPGARPLHAVAEYHAAIDALTDVELRTTFDGNELSCWLVVDDQLRVAARVELDD